MYRDREDRAGVRTILLPKIQVCNRSAGADNDVHSHTHAQEWESQLSTGLQLSTAHYRQRLEQPEETVPVEGGVEVGGALLAPPDREHQERVIRAALSTFDLLHFNLVRLRELLGR